MRTPVTIAIVSLSLSMLPALLQAQGAAAPTTKPSTPAPVAGSTAGAATGAVPAQATVPRSFRDIELGMSMDEVKAKLAADGLFSYRGEADVSLLPRPNESLIEVAGLSYVRRAFFQFYEGKLFVMIFAMNEKEIDHYSVWTSLSAKYGKPGSLSPSESVWADSTTRFSIERPLAIKYIDLAVFDALKAAGSAQQSLEEVLRTEFLDGL